ncbi:aspartate-semialdehyde dehydrogenase [Halorhodospira halophila]|uniref:Aspartate-semialdehyde dehydrogenase n=1 Tax=Halorhodospira halophila (strain DSM 244 / SL1) TaxID=349124 RepID=A1WY10_HALHL|nr:aspartate-semialdehyde dehydrogenase [Halorhodospira halophila]ABM62572.1 aspartate semialdehyde dehydrogenase [Halorhodospira halophila SL1]MBK1728251.1 aspartate-semialdehyde dehydrogenase [Halorhodospira halophila]
MSKQYDVAVVGATGAVGEVMLSILAERGFPARKIYPLASARSAGRTVSFAGQELEIQDLAQFDFSQVQIALFSAGGSISAEHAPRAAEAGAVVIDNTSHFRYDDDIPLIIPEVNPHAVAGYKKRGIIANPNCSTIQMLVALKPIHDAVGIERINVATYQAVSGSGKPAIDELNAQSRAILDGGEPQCAEYPKPIAFNCLPHIDDFQDNGYTKEEMKMVWETIKIFEDSSVRVNPTTVRVPVVYGHSEAVHIETRERITAERARQVLSSAPGVEVLDERTGGGYPTALTEAAGRDPVYVGRIREDISHERGLDLWVVADNVRKGAALNSVQIAELLIGEHI